MRRSGTGQHRKVEEARRVAPEALGDSARVDQPPTYVPLTHVPLTQTTKPAPVKDESIRVLTIGEVAVRLGISRTEVERLIAAGKLRALETGYTVMVPSAEVERLSKGGGA